MRLVRRGAVAMICCVTASLLFGCGKKKDDDGPITAAPPIGGASNEALTMGLGLARGLDSNLAPSSTQWQHVIVSDDKHALISGEAAGHAIAIVTQDAGKTWRSFDIEAQAWSGWSVGPEGTIAFATGTRVLPKGTLPPGTTAPIDSVRLNFPSLDDGTVGAASQLFPVPPAFVNARITAPFAIPASLGKDIAAFIVEDGPRKPTLIYGGPPGASPGDPTLLPPAERFVSTPYGRPAMMLSIAGAGLLARVVLSPGKPIDAPHKITGIRSTPTLAAELARGPGCEAGEWSFQRVSQGAKQSLLGVSVARLVAFPLPDGMVKGGAFGCVAEKGGAERVVVETVDPKLKASSLAVCDLEGKCAPAQNAPFRSWPEAHDQSMSAVVTSRGVVAALTSRAGDRWGLYVSDSTDGGGVYEIQRAVGEGSGDRGRIELGAMLSFGKRALLLLSADVTGTSRRGWYVSVSDDDGVSWSPP